MKMDPGLDTGEILAQEKTLIRDEDNSETLHARLATLGAELLAQTIPEYVAGRITPRPQPAEGVVYAPKIKKQDGLIAWEQPAQTIWNQVRGLVPWPGAFTWLPGSPAPQLLKIWQAAVQPGVGPPGEVLRADKAGIVIACGLDALRILTLQREGGRRMNAQEFLAGRPLKVGERV
jgi:methionyl-tRNA formyltransferase